MSDKQVVDILEEISWKKYGRRGTYYTPTQAKWMLVWCFFQFTIALVFGPFSWIFWEPVIIRNIHRIRMQLKKWVPTKMAIETLYKTGEEVNYDSLALPTDED